MPHTLLLADDSVTVQRVIELTFADENVRVVAVGDGDAAIERIERDPPDIVLADIGMPGRDGYDVATFVKQRADLSHIPVVLLAGAFEPVDRSRAEAIGCDDVLVKPFEPHLVVARVKELLAGETRVRSLTRDTAEPPSARPESPEELFSRLDEAFARFDTPAEAQRQPVVLPPTPDRAPSFAPPHEGVSQPESAQDGAIKAPPELLVDAFHAVLAMERGEKPVTRIARTPPVEAAVDSSQVDLIVERVLARLSDPAVRDAVREIVGPIAERLVREEIERIKSSL